MIGGMITREALRFNEAPIHESGKWTRISAGLSPIPALLQ